MTASVVVAQRSLSCVVPQRAINCLQFKFGLWAGCDAGSPCSMAASQPTVRSRRTSVPDLP
jgi:hypothetical protein